MAWMTRRRARAGAVEILLTAALIGLAAPAQAAPSAGEAVFEQQCAVCHSAKAGEIVNGPSLARLVGRKVGSVADYPYSPAMAQAGGLWTADRLDAFILAPRKAVPRTNMAFPGLADATRRAELIAYLSSLK